MGARTTSWAWPKAFAICGSIILGIASGYLLKQHYLIAASVAVLAGLTVFGISTGQIRFKRTQALTPEERQNIAISLFVLAGAFVVTALILKFL